MDAQNAPVGSSDGQSSAAPNASSPSPANPVASPKPLFSVRRLLIIGVLGAIAAVLIYISPRFFNHEEPAPVHPRLEMGGTSIMYVIVENKWKKPYLTDKHVQLVYDSTGTTAGVQQLLDGKAKIAFTHGALTPEQRQKAKEKGGDVVHLPVLFFGVAPVYNVAELNDKTDENGKKTTTPPLNLTGETLANIFLGKITRWDDPAIAASNPGVALPKKPIIVVHRSDSSGTTLVFTEYLEAVTQANGAWRNQYGPPASSVKWPTTPNFVPAARNLGVAEKVHETDGAIGYVDRMFTKYDVMDLKFAAVQNKDKTGYVLAEPEKMTAAGASILGHIPDDLIFDLANKPGKDSYPISGVIYAVCFQHQPADSRQRVVDFLQWSTHDAQPEIAKMTFAPLPPELVKRVDQKLEAIKNAP